MKNLFKNFAIIFLSLFVIASILSFASFDDENVEEVGLNTLVREINNESVEKIEVKGDTLVITQMGENAPIQEVKKEMNQSFSELMDNYGVEPEKLQNIEVIVSDDRGAGYWLAALAPYLLPFLLIIGLIYFMSRQVKGVNNTAMGFGQSSAKQNKPGEKEKKTFEDVAGAKEAKEELEEVVEFLKHPKKFADIGAKIPKGVLLMGQPGTGKTLLAKAVAGQADVPFFHISGSEFVEMFVGVGASRVRDLFNKAKKAAPAIIFIDEIDAVGRKRGAGLGGSHDEREQTLNQILVEMDGFEPNSGVIVVAATNRPDVLDKALLRPGRFDRRVIIDMPDINDREAILKVHAKNKPIDKSVSLRNLAERTPGFSGADLANLLNEAAILAVRRGKKKIYEEDVLESIEKVLLGPQKKSRIMTDKEREMTAYHEAGHAIVGHFLAHCDPVRKVSIVGRGMAGGYTLSMPEKDIRYQTMSKFNDDLAMTLGGYVTERLVYGDSELSTGPSNDLKQATGMATSMVMRYGMSDRLGPRQYGEKEELIFLAQEIHDKKNYSEKTAELIDAEINRILEDAKERAKSIVEKNKDKMDKLVEVLLDKETVEQKEFIEIVGPKVKKSENEDKKEAEVVVEEV
ncbi:MAG: ATP-dependent zinc metalloprotease FtsH [Candidatus Magasanikbacteria bacterium]|nr:ATP-dependent zinc metalloprotease FtsH [Candidatus Magasanikbacteria bacterium]